MATFLTEGNADPKRDGYELRQIAEQGFAALGLQCNQNFTDDLTQSLWEFLNRQPWERCNSIVWIDFRPGATSHLNIVRRGENAESPAVEQLRPDWVKALQEKAEREPGVLSPDRPMLIRAAAEFLAQKQNLAPPVRVNVRSTMWWYWIPISLIAALAFSYDVILWWRSSGSRILKFIAIALLTVTVFVSADHIAITQLSASPRIASLAQASLHSSKARDDFMWLVQQRKARGHKVGTLLQHVELSDMQRHFFTEEVDPDYFRQFILLPWINSPSERIHWRRMLWEAFYPRIRRETDPLVAARSVVRFLRERVTISNQARRHQSVPDMWAMGFADEDGFEHIYVAALRSVGIGARLSPGGVAELFYDGGWRMAPRASVQQVIK